MSAPEPKVEPKSREQLWEETIMGFVVFILGCAMLWEITVGEREHGAVLTWVAAGLIGFGLFSTNRKLAKDFMVTVREQISLFLKGREKSE